MSFVCRKKESLAVVCSRILPSAAAFGTAFKQKLVPDYCWLLLSITFEYVFELLSPPCRTVPCSYNLDSANCTVEHVFYRF